ncbi:MAG: hypothetical protein KKF44_03555, partial [Nanoarchaeota archaeon]|nr:hypothetical protein [Nanoarchaeota archaeon]
MHEGATPLEDIFLCYINEGYFGNGNDFNNYKDNECENKKYSYEGRPDSLVERFNLCDLVNRHIIDEVWVWGGSWFGFHESTLIGDDVFFVNSGGYEVEDCKREFVVLGLNYYRPEETIHSFGHRTESILDNYIPNIYKKWDGNKKLYSMGYSDTHYVDTNTIPENPDDKACGNIHFPPNARKHYELINGKTDDSIPDSPPVLSRCDSWQTEYPQNKDPSTYPSAPIDCNAWSCTEQGYYDWWFTRIPKKKELGIHGELANWWKYIWLMDWDDIEDMIQAEPDASAAEFAGTEEAGVLTPSDVPISHKGYHHIEVSACNTGQYSPVYGTAETGKTYIEVKYEDNKVYGVKVSPVNDPENIMLSYTIQFTDPSGDCIAPEGCLAVTLDNSRQILGLGSFAEQSLVIGLSNGDMILLPVLFDADHPYINSFTVTSDLASVCSDQTQFPSWYEKPAAPAEAENPPDKPVAPQEGSLSVKDYFSISNSVCSLNRYIREPWTKETDKTSVEVKYENDQGYYAVYVRSPDDPKNIKLSFKIS